MDNETLRLFEQHRRRLFGIAYRILGVIAESEDIVQEAWLRYQAETETLREPAAWLSRVTARLALDALRAAHRRRLDYIGPWLPELVPSHLLEESPDDPEKALLLRDAASTAFLRLLEILSPTERVAFVLRQVFDTPYDEIALALERSEAACRQLVSRAIRKIGHPQPPTYEHDEAHQHLLFSLAQALHDADIAQLTALLAPEVTLYSDGGGEVKAARKPIYHADRVLRFLLGLARKSLPSDTWLMHSLNGDIAFLLLREDAPFALLTITCYAQSIHEIQLLNAPSKIARIIALLPSIEG
jgi:RNA polymerase sigma-70 factor (ECF subfamily)